MFDELLGSHTPNQGRDVINANFARIRALHEVDADGVIEVEQEGHGLAVGQFIVSNGSQFLRANSTSHESARVAGVVSEVVSEDKFKYTAYGIVSMFTGLNAGGVYYLSTGGLFSANPGLIIKPLFLYLGEGRSLLLHNESRTALDFAQPILAASFNDTSSTYFVAPESMRLGDASESGEGSVTYFVGEAGAAVDDDDFTVVSLPVDLVAGQILRIFVDEDIGDFKTVTLRRLA